MLERPQYMSPNNLYRSSVKDQVPPDHLDEQVLARMQAMRAAEAKRASSRNLVPLHRAPAAMPSRRGFLAAGASVAACLGLVALGLGVADKDEGVPVSGERGELSANQLAYGGRPFGLAVAAEAEPGVPLGLATGPDSLMPVNRQLGDTYDLKMNLALVGEGIVSATYSIRDAPTFTVLKSAPTPEDIMHQAPVERYAVFFSEVAHEVLDEQGYQSWFGDWMDRHGGDGEQQELSFAVDLASEPGWNGEERFWWGGACRVLKVCSLDSFWACDPLLAAKRAWLDASVSHGQQELALELYNAYAELFWQTCSTYEGAAAWLRSCHAKALRLAADTLSRAVLDVEATFDDGSRALRSYRISAVEGLEEVADARFDALLGRYGLSWKAFEPGAAPYGDFAWHAPAADEPDPRLTAPLFAITDVTAY